MTALAIKTQNFLSRVLNNCIESRMRSAEYEIARMLHREYPGESFDYVLQMVRQGKVGEMYK
jgi:hypothetical protein